MALFDALESGRRGPLGPRPPTPPDVLSGIRRFLSWLGGAVILAFAAAGMAADPPSPTGILGQTRSRCGRSSARRTRNS
jgi:hypothetical protein